MITVSIYINTRPVYTRSARNIRTISNEPGKTLCEYAVDDGRLLQHVQQDGAPKLAQMMLAGIQDELLNKDPA